MKEYQRVIKRRILLLGAAIGMIGVFASYNVFGATEEMKGSNVFEFQVGLAVGLGIMAAFLCIRYRHLLSDEKKLLLQYNRENDERYKAIRQKAGMPMLLITSVILIVAGIVAGYFSEVVFVTLVAAGTGQLLLGCIVKMVYMKKM